MKRRKGGRRTLVSAEERSAQRAGTGASRRRVGRAAPGGCHSVFGVPVRFPGVTFVGCDGGKLGHRSPGAAGATVELGAWSSSSGEAGSGFGIYRAPEKERGGPSQLGQFAHNQPGFFFAAPDPEMAHSLRHLRCLGHSRGKTSR